ncbi:MAG: methyltransferase domain-containing protein [Burkholderiaceae bacterium]|nr:methyltransferase domain-containing protein [Burkholderiaceae bacterium]
MERLGDCSVLLLQPQEFKLFQAFILAEAGITLSDKKHTLVQTRLTSRIHQLNLTSFIQYYKLIVGKGGAMEAQRAIDLLTTNETYFFREPKHFEMLRELAKAATAERRGLRVWSAASSSGEEAYSIAMVLDDAQGALPWEVLGSDISARMLRRARNGHYPDVRTTHLPLHYRRQYCLKGTGVEAGTLLVKPELREKVQFTHVNLVKPLVDIGNFDVIFLRNVMIYFNLEQKQQVIARIATTLKPGGTLMIGHSESLQGIESNFQLLAPAIYRLT